MSYETTGEKEARERFGADTEHHEMTILHDDGMYRHVRFERRDPKSGKLDNFYWFDLITWPGSLAVNGDCGSFVFSRLEDMFEFFRGSEINPGYWAEKVRSADRSGVTAYSPERFRQLVTEYAAESAQDWPGLPEAVERQIFGDDSEWNTEIEHDAWEALGEFEFGASSTAECSCGERAEGLSEDDAVRWRVGHQRGHTVTIRRVDGFTFTDSWEWSLHDYHWQFLWCCNAIRWGVERYDKARAAKTPTAKTPTVETVAL